MNIVSIKSFIGAVIQSLAWGPPYWPEICVALATCACIMWLVLRLSRKPAAEQAAEAPKES